MDIRTFILNELEKLDNGSISLSELVNKLYNKMQSETGNILDEQVINSINLYITKYQNKEIAASDVVNYFQNIMNINQQPSSNRGGSNNISSNDKEVVDVDVDIVLEASDQYSNIENILSSSTIEIPKTITSYAFSVKEVVEKSRNENQETLNSTKNTLVNLIQNVQDIDNEIANINLDKFDFNDIWALAYNRKTGSNLKVADLDFFKQNKDCIINGDEVTFIKDGKTYKYNLSTKLLKVNGESVKVGFFVPSHANDYSKLNTFTYFTADGYENIAGNPSNAIVIRFSKNDVQSTDNRGNHKFGKRAMVPEATKFMNGVAKTNLNNCQNIIGGDSLYGAESLKLAASNGDLYKTVYCVNNAILVTGKNATRGEKVQFGSIDELKGLEGKNIYFISATGDPNFDHCAKNGSGWKSCGYNEGYVFTGLDLVAKNCPSANVFLVYSKTGKSGIIKHYNSLDKKYANVHYLSDKWNCFAKKDYQTHGDGNRIMPDLISSVVTGYNAYSL